MRRLFLLLLLALPMCQPPEAEPRRFPLPVGIDSFHKDEPFWTGTAHATAHEIWIEPVSRFVGTLELYLKAVKRK